MVKEEDIKRIHFVEKCTEVEKERTEMESEEKERDGELFTTTNYK